ncbi:MAG: hypothetical protein IPI79_08310 [Moraxellaceae bacterium]|nr:hypothetical protein [Moraxellaceae bacterium]
MRYLAYLVLSLSLASCSIASSTPVLNDVLASKGDTRPFETPLPVNTAHKKLAIGYGSTVGVKEDGTVWSWGGELHGELGNGEEIYKAQYTPQPIQKMTDFIEVAGTGSHFLALHKDGTVWSWGSNKEGQLGYATTQNYSATPQLVVGLKDIVSVATGYDFSLALDKQGTVYMSGVSKLWKINVDKSKAELNKLGFTPIFKHQNAIKIITNGGANAVLMKANGELVACCDGTVKEFPKNVVDMAMSLDASYFLLSNGLVLAEGNNRGGGYLGQGDFTSHTGVVQVKNIGRIKSITANGSGGVALDEKGRIWQWGANVRYPFIAGVQSNYEPLPVHIKTFTNTTAVQGGRSNSVLLDDGHVYFWGWERGGGRGTGKVRGHEQSSSKDWSVPEKSLWTWK